jgi:hypothetical protein
VHPADPRELISTCLREAEELRNDAHAKDPRFPARLRVWLRKLGQSNLESQSVIHALRGNLEAVEDAAPTASGSERPAASQLRMLWREQGLDLLATAEDTLTAEGARYESRIRAFADEIEQAIRLAAAARRLPGPGPERGRWLDAVWQSLIAHPPSRVHAVRVAASLPGRDRRTLLDLVFRESFDI